MLESELQVAVAELQPLEPQIALLRAVANDNVKSNNINKQTTTTRCMQHTKPGWSKLKDCSA